MEGGNIEQYMKLLITQCREAAPDDPHVSIAMVSMELYLEELTSPYHCETRLQAAYERVVHALDVCGRVLLSKIRSRLASLA